MSEKRTTKITGYLDRVIEVVPPGDDSMALVGIRGADTGSYLNIALTPDQAIEAARALLGSDKVVVRADDLKRVLDAGWGHLSSREAMEAVYNVWGYDSAPVNRLRKALGPGPCPAHIKFMPNMARCTLPKGHDGDHIPPATAWTVPS